MSMGDNPLGISIKNTLRVIVVHSANAYQWIWIFYLIFFSMISHNLVTWPDNYLKLFMDNQGLLADFNFHWLCIILVIYAELTFYSEIL